jgi:hypothetical protein
MIMIRRSLAVGLLAAAPALAVAQTAATVTVKAENKLPLARTSQTIELSAKDLEPLGEKDLKKIRVADAKGQALLCQAVDEDGDGAFDQVLFQSDFAANETKTFTVTRGAKWEYKKEDFRAFGRFNRERFDDFAWENDRIAHRTYGKALETWKAEPLTSSAIDVWLKRTPRMVINDWYMVDNYHADTGEGADLYSAGPSRGVGGSGLWANNKVWLSKNFVASRTIAAGPIRVAFELTYEPFDVNGTAVGEVKRITLDAGHNLSRIRNTYKPAAAVPLVTAIGIRKTDVINKDGSAERGSLTSWEPVKKGAAGHMGGAVVVDPKVFHALPDDDRNLLIAAKVPADNVITYWAGAGWDKSGHFADYAAWKAYVDQFAQGAHSPIVVTASTK